MRNTLLGMGGRCDQTKQENCGRCFAVRWLDGHRMSFELVVPGEGGF